MSARRMPSLDGEPFIAERERERVGMATAFAIFTGFFVSFVIAEP